MFELYYCTIRRNALSFCAVDTFQKYLKCIKTTKNAVEKKKLTYISNYVCCVTRVLVVATHENDKKNRAIY